MEPEQIIRSGIAASLIAHFAALMLMVFFADVHPFASVTAETITVELVAAPEIEPALQKPEPAKPEPLDFSKLALLPAAAVPAPPPAAPRPPASPPPPLQQATLEPQSRSRPSAQSQPQPATPSAPPAFTPPEPDLSVKYHVMLGLPPALPAAAASPDKPSDGFDALAAQPADIASSLTADFRRHLKTCSKLPGSIAATDKIEITLRVMMTPEGRLAAEPVPIGVRHPSENGPALMQSAIEALRACEPYQMLPADRYREWKMLDLSFTARDFTGG